MPPREKNFFTLIGRAADYRMSYAVLSQCAHTCFQGAFCVDRIRADRTPCYGDIANRFCYNSQVPSLDDSRTSVTLRCEAHGWLMTRKCQHLDCPKASLVLCCVSAFFIFSRFDLPRFWIFHLQLLLIAFLILPNLRDTIIRTSVCCSTYRSPESRLKSLYYDAGTMGSNTNPVIPLYSGTSRCVLTILPRLFAKLTVIPSQSFPTIPTIHSSTWVTAQNDLLLRSRVIRWARSTGKTAQWTSKYDSLIA